MGSLVGLTLGAFTPEGPKRDYQKSNASAARLSGDEELTVEPAERKAQTMKVEPDDTKKPGKKRKSGEAGGKLAEVRVDAPGGLQSKHQRKGAETAKQAVGSGRAEPAPKRKSGGKEGSIIDYQKASLAPRIKGKGISRTRT